MKRLRLDERHQEIVDLLKEALLMIDRPSPNFSGYPMQAGAAWWRLEKVMEWLAQHVEKADDRHCFEIHGYPQEQGRQI